ncbi:LTA synthase family protein [Pedobacter sp. Hv1]|uniref:LTA synthase family protein n=1 Tax=Pedobacter sp. Hv1 TaxID=1740090 RepID=UPI0006D89D92|nr:alkaline phosphatase family protein [Pedobacter sp. Hv1]KQC00665.1 sulfatase [Pedobacter sp. Hv1]
MIKSLIFFVRFFLFWLLFFAIDRFIFLAIFHQKLRAIPFTERLSTFYHALRLDLSMTAYLAVIPLLPFIFWYFTKKTTINFKWVAIYNKILIVLFSIFSVVNFNIYREWGSKLNAKAFSFAIDTPNEALASSASSPILLSLGILAILLCIGLYLNFLIIKNKITFVKSPIWLKAIVAILLIGFNFLLIRGGVDVAPNSQSMAYFSKHQLLNHASLNTEWNLMSSILASKKTNHNPYIYFKQTTADQEVAQLYHVQKDTTVSILKVQRPNVVIFILESFTADLTKTLGNENGITPKFDSLINQGLLFSEIYSAGNRTDKGLIGTLTGFPTLGTGSIVKWPEKMQKIPAISQKLVQNSYQTSFFYGGESEFDNYKAFILSHGYQKLVDKNSFDPKDMNSKWGAYDGLVFTKQLESLNQTKQPFFSTILSLTNHEPFELPVRSKFGTRNNVEKFKSTAYYTDSCINAYLNTAKKQNWYKNTLFIFVADHGHILPKNNSEVFEPRRYHIPLLFYGDVIKEEFKGKKLSNTGSQQDIAATLLNQLNIPAKDFLWSKNLLNPYTQHFAFFSWDNGLGFIYDKHSVTFDNIGKNILYNSNPKDKLQTDNNLKLGQSYLQSVYQQFIKL